MTHFLLAGPVSVRYEAGFLRHLTLAGAEVVRMIYFAIRDHNWQTAQLTITNERIDQTANSFQIQYDWQTADLGIQMAGRVMIQGEADGMVSVDFYGKATNRFARNRIGICVLHPLDGVTGQPCRIESPDGQQLSGWFPDDISPHQPFLDIQTLRWQPASGPVLQLDFLGDVFETEDQRNWTDASFKTYSTPLTVPFPVVLSPGETVQQRVVFRISTDELVSDEPSPAPRQRPESTDNVPHAAPVKPRLGLGQRADKQPLSESEASQLRKLPLSHLRADVLLTTANWQTGLANAIADVRALNVSLELALFFGDHPVRDLTALQQFMASHGNAVGPDTVSPDGVSSILVFDSRTLMTTDVLLNQVVAPLRTAWPNALIGGGTDGFFADVNRNPFDYSQVDFLVYSITPQVHAFDDLTLLENIAGQGPTVRTTRHLTGGKPVHISPVTLLPRYVTAAQSAAERLSPPVDSRQATDFCAEWTRRSLDALTRAGVASVTYYETHGPRGLVDGELVFPVYEILT